MALSLAPAMFASTFHTRRAPVDNHLPAVVHRHHRENLSFQAHRTTKNADDHRRYRY